MSRNGKVLAIPPEVQPAIDELVAGWPDFQARLAYEYPRSQWLALVEGILHNIYPSSSSADRRLTARGLAPFPLKNGPNVP